MSLRSMPHQLDKTVPEWRILEDILPLFSADLPWCVADTGSRGFWSTIIRFLQWHRPRQSAAITTAIENEINLKNFRADLATIDEYHPHYQLPDHVYKTCKKKLSELLLVLENLVEDSVIEVASKTQPENQQVASKIQPENQQVASKTQPENQQVASKTQPENQQVASKTQPENQQVASSEETQSWLDLQSWAETPFVQAVTQFLPLNHISAQAPRLSPRASIDPEAARLTPQFQKLEILSLIVQECSNPKEDITSSCVKFIKLKQTPSQFQEVAKKANVAMRCLVDIAEKDSRNQFRIRKTRKIPILNWKNPMPWETTYRLFNMLLDKTCLGHEARFQLNGFKIDSEGENLPLDVFISSCPHKDPPVVSPSWQEGRYTYHMDEITPPRGEMTIINDLCFSSPSHRQSEHLPPVLNIRVIDFDKLNNAYERWRPTEHSIRLGATPTISLAHLLDNGFLRDVRDGGVFNVGDKAVLALSLGRCLLHCFQGLLMQQEWSSHNIHFLHQRTTSTEAIFNIHHPYVACHFPKTKEERERVSGYSTFLQNDALLRSAVKPKDCELSLWSFARLLLEIDKGQRIPLLSEPEIFQSFNDLNRGEPGSLRCP
ncbi:hypothetical protein F5B22DRAFT_109065 [Xylaria bambusicola]|uniref:uncharacterized protein n=1 Tax=Xylaria bambusicola TaxID=326684 RepID=UPI002007F883|nr:uncharacterized protein F5B22DRAFT_109065 [Xylaria bambusicola]KAI0517531.1 hypothetical protein F5B22DRAFT_109065 [Xylaria bambusicola]